MTQQMINRALDSLGGSCCGNCGTAKMGEHSFCLSCYRRLPGDMQQRLWTEYKSSYVLAYAEAYHFLTRSDVKAVPNPEDIF